jgi:uncharacterized protein YxeA
MKKVIKIVTFIIVIVLLSSCAISKPVKPVYKHGNDITKYHKQLKNYYEEMASR